jgi:hypothetical protein
MSLAVPLGFRACVVELFAFWALRATGTDCQIQVLPLVLFVTVIVVVIARINIDIEIGRGDYLPLKPPLSAMRDFAREFAVNRGEAFGVE